MGRLRPGGRAFLPADPHGPGVRPAHPGDPGTRPGPTVAPGSPTRSGPGASARCRLDARRPLCQARLRVHEDELLLLDWPRARRQHCPTWTRMRRRPGRPARHALWRTATWPHGPSDWPACAPIWPASRSAFSAPSAGWWSQRRPACSNAATLPRNAWPSPPGPGTPGTAARTKGCASSPPSPTSGPASTRAPSCPSAWVRRAVGSACPAAAGPCSSVAPGPCGR